MKAVNTSPFNNVIYPNFKAKNSLTEKDIYNKCHDKWINIKRADDNSKVIVAEAILYIASFEFLFLQNPDEIIFDKDLLLKKAIKEKKQRGRYLKQIADIYEIEYHTKYIYKGKVMRCVFSAKRTVNSLEILKNPILFYELEGVKNGSLQGQKSSPKGSNLAPSIYRGTVDQVEEKDPTGLFPSTVNTTAGIKNARARMPANQNNTPVEPPQEPQQITSQSQPATMSFECSSQLEIATNQKESVTICNQLTKLPELRRKIAKTFGIQTAKKLAYKITYIELSADKIAVKLGENVKLTEHDKERLRDCIRAVYGQNVQIVTGKPKISELVTNSDQLKPIKNPENEEPMTLALAIPTQQIAAIIPYIPTTPIWHKVRQNLINKHGSDLVNVRLKRLEITEQEGIITFTGPLSSTTLVINDFDLMLKECSELYDIVFKLVGICKRTEDIEERIIKSWHKGA